MSVGSLGALGSITTGLLQQPRSADSDRALQDARTHSREVDSARQAEAAEGVGQMTQDEGASDRDADGRRMWERTARKSIESEQTESELAGPIQSLDPNGESGGHLDLTG